MLLADAIKKNVEERKEQAVANGIIPQRTRTIAVLTPTLGRISVWWHSSVLNMIWPTNTGRAPLFAQDLKGHEVGEMRNRLVKTMLDSAKAANIELDSMLWLDDDVIASRFVLLTLRAHDVDIAAGVYFTKIEGGEPLIFAGGGSGCEPFRPNEVFESWGYAQGLSLVKTSVFERMRDELDLGVDKYGSPCWYKQPEFGVSKDGGIIHGGTEDFHFFANAEKLGIRPLVDCTKHAFGYHFDLNGMMAYPRLQWGQFVRQEPIIWPANKHHREVIWE